jgi:YVTN family beta-propeller protein
VIFPGGAGKRLEEGGAWTMRMRLIGLAFLVVWSSMLLGAEKTPSPALLILSKADRTLAVVDPQSLKVITHVPCGPDPHEVAASSDGKLAYVSNYGGGRYNTISVVDLIAQKASPAIDLGPLYGPHGLFFVQDYLYFTAEANKAIGRYDPKAGKVDWVLGTGQDRTHMIWVSQNLDRIYTSNVSSATMTIIQRTLARLGGPPAPPRAPIPSGPGRGPEPSGPGRGVHPIGPERALIPSWTETVIPVGRGSEGFDVSPDGKELWVANAEDGTISVVELSTKTVAATLNANVAGANRLKFTPDGKLVFVSSLSTGDLTILDVASRQETKRLKLGHGAAGTLMQPDGSRAFVSCSPDNFVAVIDLKTLEVVGRIEAGRDPDGLAWAVKN